MGWSGWWSRGLLLAGALALGAGSAAASDPAPPLTERIETALAPMKTGGCDGPAWTAIAADPGFADLPGSLRATTYAALATCVSGAQTLYWTMQATVEPDAPPIAWSLRFITAAEARDFKDALAALEKSGGRVEWKALALRNQDAVSRLWAGLKTDPTRRLRLLEILDQAQWTPAATFMDPSTLWLDYSRLLMNDGETADALRVAGKVTLPGALLRMRLDKRFDSVTAAAPQTFDVRRAAETVLARHRKLYATSRDDQGAYLIIEDLRLLGRFEEALQVADTALAKPQLRDTHGKDYRHWIEDRRAYVLFDMERYDEAVAQMRKAVGGEERGSERTSQLINLATLLDSAGRHAEALDVLRTFDESQRASPYGTMWVETERVCAAGALSRTAEAAKALAYTAAHAQDNRNGRVKALLCADDIDGAASFYVTWLENRDANIDALLQLSPFAAPIHSPVDDLLATRLAQVRDATAVKDAVAKVGRLETVPLQAAPWIDVY